MSLKAMIVDDEPYAIQIIERYLSNLPDIEVAATCNDGFTAFKALQTHKVDILFLDIKMPTLTGIDLLKSLVNPPKVIFTTAYPEYAVEGFDLEAIDYLVKPISFNRFLKAIDKILKTLKTDFIPHINEPAKTIDKSSFIYLKVDRKTVKVNVEDILWIESQKDYIKVVTADKQLITKNKISLIEALLPTDLFIRIHRSFIISIPKIDSYYSYAVSIGNKEIPIGRNYKSEVQEKLNNDFK